MREFELSPANAATYLGYPCSATLLGGGVSNTVLLIEAENKRFVLKQSLGKLRVEQDWFSDRRRIFRESSAMRLLAAVFPAGAVPAILFEDHDNFIFAMSAASAEAEPWKDLVLRGEVSLEAAATIGQLLGLMIRSTWENALLKSEFGDQTIFDELRIDPYYRTTAARHPEFADFFARLIAASGERRVSLVHGDWSPKNFLVSPGSVMAIDFEVIHFGDPSFDAAFLLNHLVLKSFYRAETAGEYAAAAMRFWEAIDCSVEWFEEAVIQHLSALLLARIDGKSPAEYIRDEPLKMVIRRFAKELMRNPPRRISQVFQYLDTVTRRSA